MATYKVKCGVGNYQTDAEIQTVLNYAKNPEKTDTKKNLWWCCSS